MTDALTRPSRWTEWPDWNLRLAQAADGRAVLLAAMAGVGIDAGLRSGIVTIGGWLAVLTAAVALLGSGRLHTPASRACVAGACVAGSFLPLRTSPWLVPLDLLAAAGLLVLAGMLARDGRLSNLPFAVLMSRGVLALLHTIGSVPFLVEPARRWLDRGDRSVRRRTVSSSVRGLALAAPVAIALALLLASADAIFASALRVDITFPTTAIAHAVLIAVGTAGIAWILRLASAAPPAPMPPVPWRVGDIEWTIVLGSVIAVLGGFALVQAIAIAGGGRHVLETEGLTYAEYARSGYFQLLAVTVITGVILAGVGALADRSTARAHRRYVVFAEVTLALTAVVLAVAIRRLALYEDAYGWTMLRLVAKAGAVWLGLVLVALGLRTAGVLRDRAWFLPAIASGGLAVLFALNLANPEAAVVRHNLDRATAGHELDPAYLAGLSDDAVPTLLDRLGALPEHERGAVIASVCAAPTSERGALGWNRSATRADAAREAACP